MPTAERVYTREEQHEMAQRVMNLPHGFWLWEFTKGRRIIFTFGGYSSTRPLDGDSYPYDIEIGEYYISVTNPTRQVSDPLDPRYLPQEFMSHAFPCDKFLELVESGNLVPLVNMPTEEAR